MSTLWLNVCSSTGAAFIHSMDEDTFPKKRVPRDEAIDSHIIHINITTDTKEIILPRDEITFHMVKASG